jgi:hypothetical protein
MTYETNEEWLCVVRINDDGTRTSIPLDPANSDYAEYLAQLEEEAN